MTPLDTMPENMVGIGAMKRKASCDTPDSMTSAEKKFKKDICDRININEQSCDIQKRQNTLMEECIPENLCTKKCQVQEDITSNISSNSGEKIVTDSNLKKSSDDGLTDRKFTEKNNNNKHLNSGNSEKNCDSTGINGQKLSDHCQNDSQKNNGKTSSQNECNGQKTGDSKNEGKPKGIRIKWKSKKMHLDNPVNVTSWLTNLQEFLIKATSQGLTSPIRPQNGMTVTPPAQAVLVGNIVANNKLVPGSTPSNIPSTGAQLKNAKGTNRSSLTVREMLNEQRGAAKSSASASSPTNTTTVVTSPTSTGSMVVDLTEDDEGNSPPKTGAKSVVLQSPTGLRPVIPAASLPPGIRPGTYLLQQNAGGGTVLQQLVTTAPGIRPQQGHTVVIGTQGGPAVLLQAPPVVATAGKQLGNSNVIRPAINTVPAQLTGAGQVLVRGVNPQVVGNTPAGAVPNRPPPPLQSAPTQNTNNKLSALPNTTATKTTARKRTSPSVRKKTPSQSQEDSSQDCDIMITTVTKPAPAKSHPAPLPPQPTSQATGNGKKNLPPQPTLKISRVAQGIVLSWNMTNLTDQNEDITNYQLFAYQEGSAPPTSLLWKKVGDVKALPLPMACTLTQFQEGNKYHFAVRAMDKFQRVGPFSSPSSIHLTSNGKS